MTADLIQRFGVALGTLLAALLLAGCGSDSLDTKRVERFIAQDAERRLGVAELKVDCPNDVVAKKGDVLDCTATAPDSDSISVEVTQKDAKGNVSWAMRARSTGAIETDIEQGVLKQKKLSIVANCPDIVPLKKAYSFDCVVTGRDGNQAVVAVVVTDDTGSISWSA